MITSVTSNIKMELSTTDFEVLAYFKKASKETIVNFFSEWKGKASNLNFSLRQFTQIKERMPPLTRQGINKVAKILAKKFPLLVSENIIGFNIDNQNMLVEIAKICKFPRHLKEFNISCEYQRSEIAKESAKNGSAAELIYYFESFAIKTPHLLNGVAEVIADVRPDLLIENLQSFHPLDDEVMEGLIAKYLPQVMSYNTSEKINDLVNKYSYLLKQNPQRIERKVKDNALEKSNEEKILSIAYRNVTLPVCGITVTELLKVIFGEENYENELETVRLQHTEEDIDLMFSIIKENACGFEETSISQFFVYSIASESIDHNFLIIQFQDEEFNIRYKLLQSWMLRYKLEDYMKNRANTLSSAEFDKFCEGLKHVWLFPTWTHEKGLFYNSYFMHDPWRKIGTGHLIKPWNGTAKLIFKHGSSSY